MRRKRIWAGLLACLLCLGGCEPKGPELLPGFEGLMDKEMRRELADCIQTPEATASDGNTRILQTVGDEWALRLLVEVTFSGEVDQNTVSPAGVFLYAGELPEEAERSVAEEGSRWGEIDGWGLEVWQRDEESRAVTYLIEMTGPGTMAGEMTLCLAGFHDKNGPVEEPEHYIIWTAKNEAEELVLELKDPAGETVGEVMLSPFSLRVDASQSALGLTGEKLSEELRFLRNGTEEPVELALTYGNAPGGEEVAFAAAFSQAQDLEQITAVLMGECRAELP